MLQLVVRVQRPYCRIQRRARQVGINDARWGYELVSRISISSVDQDSIDFKYTILSCPKNFRARNAIK